jgi:hypothetical protein
MRFSKLLIFIIMIFCKESFYGQALQSSGSIDSLYFNGRLAYKKGKLNEALKLLSRYKTLKAEKFNNPPNAEDLKADSIIKYCQYVDSPKTTTTTRTVTERKTITTSITKSAQSAKCASKSISVAKNKAKTK